MNIEARRELMAVICEISELVPYYRLGQLVGLLTDHTEHPYESSAICEIEDDEILPAAKDPRNYRVSFERIERVWGFRAETRVGQGIAEVAQAIRAGKIPEPLDARYVNA